MKNQKRVLGTLWVMSFLILSSCSDSNVEVSNNIVIESESNENSYIEEPTEEPVGEDEVDTNDSVMENSQSSGDEEESSDEDSEVSE